MQKSGQKLGRSDDSSSDSKTKSLKEKGESLLALIGCKGRSAFWIDTSVINIFPYAWLLLDYAEISS